MKRKCSKTFCFDSKQWAEKVGKDISLTSYFLIKFYDEIEHKLLKITLVQLTLSYIAQQTQLTASGKTSKKTAARRKIFQEINLNLHFSSGRLPAKSAEAEQLAERKEVCLRKGNL